MDKKQTIDIVKIFAKKIKEYLPVREIILYGSWAKDTATEDSDIDVAVVLNSNTLDYLDVGKQLYRHRRTVDLRIEPVLLPNGDDYSGFSDMVHRTGIQVFP